MKTPKSGIIASELSKQLKSDPDYQARVRERDAKIEAAIIRAREEQKPILTDLQAIGIKIDSIWSQHLHSKLNREAIDILMKHLKLAYSEGTREGLAVALGTTLSREYWPVLISEYKNCDNELENSNTRNRYKDALACTLAKIVSKDTMSEYVDLLRTRSNGSSRILLLSALRRSRDPRARQALEDLADDPDLAKEIAAWKKRRGKKSIN